MYTYVHENKSKSHLLLCLKMSHITLKYLRVLSLQCFFTGPVYLAASTYRGDKNAHNDFLFGIILVSLGFLGLLYCFAYKRY